MSLIHEESWQHFGRGLVALEGCQGDFGLGAPYCLCFVLMILLLVEMMNQSLGTYPNFGEQKNG